jgi:glucuronokinase
MFWRTREVVATARTHARAALVGNPSDGYGGRTIAFTFEDLFCDVTVKPADRFTVEAERAEGALLRAAYGRFAAHCIDSGVNPAPCKLSVRSCIPAEVGLAGSSAIVIAALRALCRFHDVSIAEVDLPTVALAAEEDLEIPAGLQDRVAQVYGGLVYMDFAPELLAADGHGRYERIESSLLDHAYVAWCPRAGVHSGVFHRELRRRFRSGDPVVRAGLARMAELAEQARDCLESDDLRGMRALVDENFDLRRQLGPLDPLHVRMVEAARAAGACANYAGSGGSITGFVSNPEMLAELTCALAPLGATVIRPSLAD